MESDAIFLSLLGGRLTAMPGLPELLAALETAGIPKAIATSSGRRLTEASAGPSNWPLGSVSFSLRKTSRGGSRIRRFTCWPRSVSACRLRTCSCSKTARTAAVPRSPPRGFTVAVPGEHSCPQDFMQRIWQSKTSPIGGGPKRALAIT